jgi:hypothetical protein
VNYKYNKIGISLIVLVITIIVIVILAGAVILTLSANNPINSANESVFKSDLDAIESDLSLYVASEYANTTSFSPDSLNADDLSVDYNGNVIVGKTIKDIIPALSTTNKYNGQFEVVNGKLVYVGTDRTKKRWAQETNVDVIDADRLDAIISTTTTLPISAGTDVVTTIKISSNASINNINLTSKLELLDKNNVSVTVQPLFEIGSPTGTGLDTLRTVEVTIKTDGLAEGIYKLKLKPYSISNIYDVTNSIDIISSELFEIDNTPPTNPEMSSTPTGWTDLDVSISITYPLDSVTKEYSLDGTSWNVYTNPITVNTNNTTIYARAIDIAGNQSGQSTITIANIDRESPTVIFGTNGGNNLQVASTKVTVTDVGVSNVDITSLKYIWDTQNVDEPTGQWNTFVNGEVINKVDSNGTYYLWIKALDNTGNSVTTKSNAFAVDNIIPVNPTMSASPTGWTNGNVTVTITYSADAVVKEYSTDTLTWSAYIAPVVISTNNTTVYARASDASGNQSEQSTMTVANIDKVIPVITAENDGSTTSSITVKATASDLGGSALNNGSYQYSKDNGVTWTALTNVTSYTFSSLTTGAYQCKVKVLDNAGNSAISNTLGISTVAVGTITMSASPTTWTNGNVTVTIAYPAEVVTKQYSLNGTTWSTYTSAVIVTTNGTLYARGYDAGNNQTTQATITIANIDKTLPVVSNSVSGGMIFTDQKFQNGINNTYVYNNLGNGTVTNTRIAMADSPTGSGYGLEVRTTGTPSPGWGGFYFANMASANKVFITKIIASIPVGYTINWASNAFGDGGTITWLTSQDGTGTWQEYVCKVTCGPTGAFSSTNFYYLTGGATPTSSNPLVWRVAYATVFDTTLWKTTSNAIVSATDTSGIVGYGINQSSVTAPTFTNISARVNFATVFENITVNGTYYVWLKDQAGNVTNTSILVNYIDNIVPTVTYGTNGGTVVTASTTVTINDTGGSNLNTSTLQYVWDIQNVTTPVSGWNTFTNGTTITNSGTGTYYLWIKGSDNAGNNVITKSNAFVTVPSVNQTFGYNGSYQTWTVPYTGTYKLEVWGAQGGNNWNIVGGLGAYSSGNINLTAGTILYVYVGGQNGYNGGGTAGTGSACENGANGGGATDIRLSGTALANRIIVAGGGGGASGGGSGHYQNATGYNGAYGGGGSGIGIGAPALYHGAGGSAGGTGAGNGGSASGGDITSMSTYAKGYNGGNGSLGQGGSGGGVYGDRLDYYGPGSGGGGGGGYYGGGGGGGGAGWWGSNGGAGGGGSCYIGGVTSGQTIAGNATMPGTAGGSIVGNSGNGYVKITNAP